MDGWAIKKADVEHFRQKLILDEKSEVTIEKYIRDVDAFEKYAGENIIEKDTIIRYKEKLISDGYAPRSINSMLASINSFFAFLGRHDLHIKTIKIQHRIYCPEEKELTKSDYIRLVRAAKNRKNERLYLLLQTICGTGIRVSELRFVTVEGVRRGEVTVSCKGKTRPVLIVRELQKKLLMYAEKNGITSGCIFITRNGNPINRTNIWRDMKSLCKYADVSPSKVFPHNLRHLFARVFYGIEKDIAKLADILGHSNINTTRIYIESSGQEHRKYIENMRLVI